MTDKSGVCNRKSSYPGDLKYSSTFKSEKCLSNVSKNGKIKLLLNDNNLSLRCKNGLLL